MGKITRHAWFYNFSLTILQSCHLFMTDTRQPPEAASFVCFLQISSSRSFSCLHAPCCPCWRALPCSSLLEVERELKTEGEALSSPQVSPSARPSTAPPHSCRLHTASARTLKKLCGDCSLFYWLLDCELSPGQNLGHLHLCSLITNNNSECTCWGKEA